MKFFVVFEVAPPFRWKWKHERAGEFYDRFIFMWFSVSIVWGMGWPEYNQRHAFAAIDAYKENPEKIESHRKVKVEI